MRHALGQSSSSAIGNWRAPRSARGRAVGRRREAGACERADDAVVIGTKNTPPTSRSTAGGTRHPADVTGVPRSACSSSSVSRRSCRHCRRASSSWPVAGRDRSMCAEVIAVRPAGVHARRSAPRECAQRIGADRFRTWGIACTQRGVELQERDAELGDVRRASVMPTRRETTGATRRTVSRTLRSAGTPRARPDRLRLRSSRGRRTAPNFKPLGALSGAAATAAHPPTASVNAPKASETTFRARPSLGSERGGGRVASSRQVHRCFDAPETSPALHGNSPV